MTDWLMEHFIGPVSVILMALGLVAFVGLLLVLAYEAIL